MKPLRWEAQVAYVGTYEVGRISRRQGSSELLAAMLGQFGLTVLGEVDYNDLEAAAELIKKGKRMIEDNWKGIARALASESATLAGGVHVNH